MSVVGLKILKRTWMPKDCILLVPERRPLETDEEFQLRCGVITNIGTEDYPGQAYFHRHNPRIKRAELNWAEREGGEP